LKYDSVRDIKANPEAYEGKNVTISGKRMEYCHGGLENGCGSTFLLLCL